MNFLEALEKLKNGECERIRAIETDIEICSINLLVAINPSVILGDWTLVKPKPVYEERKIKIYFNVKTKVAYTIDPDAPKPSLSSDWVLMTGMQKVEVKQPVKKTYEFPLSQTTCTPSGLGNYKISGTAEIEPDKDKIVKNMTLTINWEEHEKEDKSTDELKSSDLPVDRFIIQTIIDDFAKSGPFSQFIKGSKG